MRKKIMYLSGFLGLLFLSIIALDLRSNSSEELIALKVFQSVEAQIYQACPGTEVSLSHMVDMTLTCPEGGSNGTIPHLRDYYYFICEDGGWCCPMDGFNPPPTCNNPPSMAP
jgi:hypothetical protein